MSLKHKVEENELDLSLNDLTEVPVKELVHDMLVLYLLIRIITLFFLI